MKNLLSHEIRRPISRFITNLRGWRTNRKIVVIESDDWGSIRMPSKEVYQNCLKAGYRVDLNAYEKYDSLASEDDLELLFDLLTSFKDRKGNHPVITANSLVANPDFQKIRESNFEEYHYESIKDTFQRYPNHANCLQLWKTGINEGVFYPQSHGREHLNVSMFMNALRSRDEDALFGFEHEMPGCIPKGNGKGGNKYVEALKYNGINDKKDKLNIVIKGLDNFNELFGYSSESFIAPNYRWSPDFNEAVAKKGVKYLQGQRKFLESISKDSVKLHSQYLGKKTTHGQIYLLRNAVFEPSMFKLKVDDWVSRCLKDIDIAFKLKKPAVICSHRINYVGFLDEKNRDSNLKMLHELMKGILSRWPDTEFLNSEELGRVICEEN